jgi:hypothetical protein
MAEPLSPEASMFAEMWYRRLMRDIDESLATLRRLEAMEPRPKRPGQPPGPRAFRSLEEFEALLRQVMAWLEKTYPTVPKWRIANAMYRLSRQQREQRQDLQRALHRTAPDGQDEVSESCPGR